VVGKYTDVADSYKSLHEALTHGGIANESKVEIVYLDAEKVSNVGAEAALREVDAVLVPGGFGERGSEGKIAAIRYARESRTPFFGICLGMQLAVIETARDVLGLAGAMSREFDANPAHPVIELMDDQRKVTTKGGTMRLGAYPCVFEEGTLARRIYREERVDERHRHRFEVNPKYIAKLEEGGLRVSGMSPDRILAEVVELREHPWFLGCQYHPEFLSRPLSPHPLFASFVKAVIEQKRERARQHPG
jgi:CTP synthase